MRQQSYAGKENVRSIVNQKSSILKLQMASFAPELDRKQLKIGNTNNISKKKLQTNSSILNKFIENGSRYETNSRRESIQSRVSIGFNKYMSQDTTNYSDEIRQLKAKNKKLTEQNRQLRKMFTDRNRQSNSSSQKSLHSFDLVNFLQDSNRVLKEKLEQNRRTLHYTQPEAHPYQNILSSQIQQLYLQAFKQAKMPNIQPLTRAISQFLKQYEDLFVKINFLVQNVETYEQQKLVDLKQIVASMKLTILYKNNPQGLQKLIEPKFTAEKMLLKSQSKSKMKSNTKQSNSILEVFAPQLLSPEDTFKMLQKLLLRITKSSNMLQVLPQKISLVKLINKLY